MPRPDVSDERRPQIIEAATRVFIRKGYRKTTMPDVAREAGLSVGGVYWYFKGKEEIVAAILEQCFQDDLEALRILLDSDARATARVRAFIARYAETYTRYEWLNPVGIQFYAEAIHDPTARAFIQKYLAHFRQALVALIEQGIQRGEFREIAPIDAANALIALEEGLALLVVADLDGFDWRRSFQAGAELMLAGLMRPAETATLSLQEKV